MFGRGPFLPNIYVSLCNKWEEPAESFIWMLKIQAIEEENLSSSTVGMPVACRVKLESVTLLAPDHTQSGKAQLRSSIVDEYEDRILSGKNQMLFVDSTKATCTAEAVGSELLYSRRGHCILKPDSDNFPVQHHGTDQEMTI